MPVTPTEPTLLGVSVSTCITLSRLLSMEAQLPKDRSTVIFVI